MEFRNLTPFDALCFASLDAEDKPYRTIVMRIGYRLVPNVAGGIDLSPMDEEPVGLCLEDECFEALNTSSPRWESDLVPFKPACDVIVIGNAHAPGGKPRSRFTVGCRIQRPDTPAPLPERPQGLNPYMAPSPGALDQWRAATEKARSSYVSGEILLGKTLVVTGERVFKKHVWPLPWLYSGLSLLSLGLLRLNPWTLTSPQPFASLPLRYEFAWGGQCRINAGEKAARRVGKKYRLTLEQQAGHPDADAPADKQAVAHTVCETNPLGRGFAQSWYVRARGDKTLPAPRIENPAQPTTAQGLWRYLRAKPGTSNATDPVRPAGFGAVGRAWLPRRALAGTYDQDWLDNRHPWLPHDFDFAYWNAAPADQQIPYLFGDERLRFVNLTPSGSPGSTLDDHGDTVLECSLPRHRAFVLTRWDNGLLLPIPMRVDTLIADLDQNRIDLVWRLVLPDGAPIRVVEARFETDPEAPLVRLAKTDPEETVHG